MLETGDLLATWALASPPNTAGTILAESLPDHRLAYLDYEGPISGGRGSVTRWDAGTYQLESGDEQRLVVSLRGMRLIGQAILQRMAGEPTWRFSFVAQHEP